MAEYDLVIVGGGPAGLAATTYALQAQLHVALIALTLGGKVSYPFELRNLPAVDSVWGAQLVRQFEALVEARLQYHLLTEVTKVVRRNDGSFQLIFANQAQIGARAVILCTGARPQRLHIPGESEYLGRGVSFSAISHAQFFRRRQVAVVGGERALTAALQLARVAEKVYLITDPKQQAQPSSLTEKVLRASNVYLFQDWNVESIVGDSYVTGVNIIAANQAARLLPVEGVFVEFGLIPNNTLAHDLVALDQAGHIQVNHRCETSLPGIFAAGDVTNVHAEQVPTAIGEGVKAALTAWEYLAARR